ncbi:MAG: TIR domain-containing protein [Chloroflexi bacterium]|nr:TIR domain-containing protein [Chloroflexota bacterium]
MPITQQVEQWLEHAGYEYHCFISWAHTDNRHMTNLARRLQTEIKEELSLSILSPRVFLDERNITVGASWEQMLQNALCKSIAMVSLCAPIYYHSEHRWCGLEWAAMEQLCDHRLPDNEFKNIIPLMVSIGDKLPQAVSSIQYIDFSQVIRRGHNFYRTNIFRDKVREIVDRIEVIANALAVNIAETNCTDFSIPEISAFVDYQTHAQELPFRGQTEGGNCGN